MFLFQLTCLLFGLFATVSNAQSQWNGWRLDAGCAPYKTKLDEAYKDMALLAGKASYDLGLVIDGDGGPEPERLPRIRRAITTIFGYRFQNEDPITADDHPVKKIKANFDKVRDPVGQGIITPPDGHYNLPGGPLFQCGVKQWKKYLADQPDPDDITHLVRERDPVLANTLGAWFHEHRFIPLKSLDETAPWLCDGENVAIVNPDLDSLTLCFPNTGDVWKEGKPLDDWEIKLNDRMTDLRRSLPATILHELIHWFTLEEKTIKNAEGNDVQVWASTVEDKPCIDHRGWFVYRSPQNQLKCRRRRGGDGDLVGAYGFKCSTNLARFYPVSAINNADSYAIFALMSFFSDWGWNYGQASSHDDDFDSVGQYPNENIWRTPWNPADVNEDECPQFNFDA
ncbi:hypothetical protein BHE90_005328 [Fusarium euwallaceae]|nr:hypothetical protein BHE90_005328 [Fusarium euwallaceae]